MGKQRPEDPFPNWIWTPYMVGPSRDTTPKGVLISAAVFIGSAVLFHYMVLWNSR